MVQYTAVISGSIITNYSRKHFLSFSPRFANKNVTQLLTGKTVWFSQSEVVLHSNAYKYRKNLENKTKNVQKNDW